MPDCQMPLSPSMSIYMSSSETSAMQKYTNIHFNANEQHILASKI